MGREAAWTEADMMGWGDEWHWGALLNLLHIWESCICQALLSKRFQLVSLSVKAFEPFGTLVFDTLA